MYQEALEKKKDLGSSEIPPISFTVLEYAIKELEISLEFYEKLMGM